MNKSHFYTLTEIARKLGRDVRWVKIHYSGKVEPVATAMISGRKASLFRLEQFGTI
jgi:hypothetical protein